MDLKTYLDAFPEAARYEGYISGFRQLDRVGVLHFTEDTACRWGGPFPGGFAGYRLEDCRNSPYHRSLKTDAELFVEERARLEKQARSMKMSSLSREHKEWKRLYGLMDRIEAGDVSVFYPGTVSLDRPYRLYVFGNDDTSYTKIFRTEEEALETLNLLEAVESLDFDLDFLPLGFEFTN